MFLDIFGEKNCGSKHQMLQNEESTGGRVSENFLHKQECVHCQYQFSWMPPVMLLLGFLAGGKIPAVQFRPVDPGVPNPPKGVSAEGPQVEIFFIPKTGPKWQWFFGSFFWDFFWTILLLAKKKTPSKFIFFLPWHTAPETCNLGTPWPPAGGGGSSW